MIEIQSLVEQVEHLQLETERLILRRFTADDLGVALEHETDPRIMRRIRDPIPHEQVVARVQSLLDPWRGGEGEWLGLAVTRRDAAAMLGLVAFRLTSIDNQAAEIGYRLHVDHQGKGYAIEAARRLTAFLFDVAVVHKVIAYTSTDNEPSFRLMEKLGMRREGTLRESFWIGGAWHDDYVYGMLEPEFERTQRPC